MQTLRLFCDVATLRSFSEAAKVHGVTQSAASQRIGQLEKKLGVTLLDRSVRPLSPTPAGEIFLEGCQDLMARYDRLERSVVGMGAEPAGRVRVAAIYSAGIDLLERVREGFEAAHPSIAVEVKYKHPDEVYAAVRDHECDLGIVSYPQRWRQVGVIPLRDEVMAVVAHPDHALTRRVRVQPKDLHGVKMVMFGADLPVGRRIRSYLKEHHVEPIVEHEFDNIDTIKNAVGLTAGVAILPKRTVMHEVEVGTLAAIELEPQLVRPLGIIFRPVQRGSNGGPSAHGGEPFTATVKLFVDYLLEHERPFAGRPIQGATA